VVAGRCGRAHGALLQGLTAVLQERTLCATVPAATQGASDRRGRAHGVLLHGSGSGF